MYQSKTQPAETFMYQNKTQLAETFGISRSKVYRIIADIDREIELGRYPEYAKADGNYNAAVFVDCMKYRKMLNSASERRYVPVFDITRASELLRELEEVQHASKTSYKARG